MPLTLLIAGRTFILHVYPTGPTLPGWSGHVVELRPDGGQEPLPLPPAHGATPGSVAAGLVQALVDQFALTRAG